MPFVPRTLRVVSGISPTKQRRISCGILALVAFLILTPFIKVAENGGITVIPVEWIGSKGLFVAMIGSLLWTELFCWLKRKNLVNF